MENRSHRPLPSRPNSRLASWALPGVALLGLLGCQSVSPDFDPRAPTQTLDQSAPNFASVEGQPQLDPALLNPPASAYRLGVGDIVEIEISEISGTRDRTFIMPDGRVYFDLAGGVVAEDLTIPELEDRLEAALAKDYTAPAVNVTLKEVRSRRFWVLGRVFSPGLYPLSQPTTLLEAISMAGGLFTSRFSGTTEELADLGNSVIIRDGKVLPVDFEALLRQGDMTQNIYLQPDDYIYLPSALSQNVYVLGAVRQPRAIGFKDRLSLMGALAVARGPRPEAHLSKVVIIRGSLSDPKAAVVDAEAVMLGKATDVALQPFDIVWVPQNPWQRFEQYFWGILETAARTVAVNEGANLIEGAEAPSVTIPASGAGN